MIGDTAFYSPQDGGWFNFADPEEIVSTRRLDEVRPLLRRIEDTVNNRRWWAAGYLAYEAAPAFDPAFSVRSNHAAPLLWFGVYRRRQEGLPPGGGRTYGIGPWRPEISAADYNRAIAAVKNRIADGITYQVNYTYRLRTSFNGDPWSFFLELATRQGRSYSAFIDMGAGAVCSASPELFFRLDGRNLMSKPMKGTGRRGKTAVGDLEAQSRLYNSPKERAENVMIVDMVRNDMGRIAVIGSVAVPELFQLERYPTLWQMTSTVTALTDAPWTEIIAALFPCASITGAPKVSTMRLIADLETSPRGVYTGCIGYLAPGRRSQFSVAIRTVTCDLDAHQAEYGVGGGIVWDSGAEAEYRESRLKAQVLFSAPVEFDLLEAVLWTPAEGFFLLDRHLKRLDDSAGYFGIRYDAAEIEPRLKDLAAALPPVDHKVNLALSRRGALNLTARPLSEIPRAPIQRVALSAKPIDDGDVFLYHKTSRRSVYESARAECPQADDAILWNKRGEITESTTANVVIALNGKLLTPPIGCGLLGGIFRGWLLDKGEIVEQVISKKMLQEAQGIFLINSVRKWMKAVLYE